MQSPNPNPYGTQPLSPPIAPPTGAPNSSPSMPPAEGKNWIVGCHLSKFAGCLFPLGNVLGPLVVWLLKKEKSPTLDEVGKEVINYNLSMTLWFFVCMPLVLLFIGFFMMGALALIDIIVTIMAAVAASNGQRYKYPLTIRFLA